MCVRARARCVCACVCKSPFPPPKPNSLTLTHAHTRPLLRQEIELQTLPLEEMERLLLVFKAGHARFHDCLVSRLAATSTQFVGPSP